MNNKVITQVLILSLVMLVGFYARKKKIINDTVEAGLNDLLLDITLPLMIIASFHYSYSKQMMVNGVKIFLYAILIHVVLIFTSKVFYFKYPDSIKKVLRFSTIFSNSAFMGYPVIQSVYGSIGVFYAAIFNIIFNIFMWTAGVMLYSDDKESRDIKRVLLNPGIISVIIGLIIFIFSIKLPEPIFKTCEMIGNMTTPISMIIVGSMLAKMRIKDIFSSKAVYYASFVRLIIVPIITFVTLKAIGASGLILDICVLIEAMPTAVVTTILAEKYGADTALASQNIFITTILSMITIPIVVMVI